MTGQVLDAVLDATGDRFYVPAHIDLNAEGRATTEELLALARKAVPDPSIFDDHEVAMWSADISTNRPDTYGTIMMPSTLKRFADGAEAGVAFQDSHRTDGMDRTLGYSLAGRFIGAGGNGKARTLADFYSVLGLEPAIDSFWRRVRAGLARDVSVGFYYGADTTVRCSICSLDMRRDFNCFHWPLFEYETVDKKGQPTGERKVAYGQIENGNLSEVSSVFDGSCPGAQIVTIKAQRAVASGDITGEKIALLEQRYRIALPHPARSFPGVEITPPPEEVATVEWTPEQVASIRLMLTEVGHAPDTAPDPFVRSIVDELRTLRALLPEIERLKPLEAECERLRPLADEGRQYRADLVEAAVLEGKRAMGAAFAEETYRGLLTSVPVETVKRMRDDWKGIGDKQFQGGRATIEGHEPGLVTTNGAVPSAAFAG